MTMAHTKKVVSFRRKREGKTNYKKRLSLLKSGKPRLVIRRSNKYITIQLTTYVPNGDKVLLEKSSRILLKHDWKHSAKSVPAAYLTGVLLAKEAIQKGLKSAIVDIGFHKHRAGTRICAAINGAVNGGLSIPVNREIFPSQERITGVHLTSVKQEELTALATKLGITLPEVDVKKTDADKKKTENKESAEKKTSSQTHKKRPKED